MAIYSAEYKLAKCSVLLPRERCGAGWGGRRRGPIYGFRMGHTRMKKLLPSAFTSVSNKKSKILFRATYCRYIQYCCNTVHRLLMYYNPCSNKMTGSGHY
jgi:hypothetical protein